eukprot:CAMPEP_0176290210 /NCGR_PEP_ID=MMETSP0121_2-20121125/54904_1 /TAXON_ID=160619 /ORGANISM="Kryptoperidinium foliaceum, Strain CCMP 1326" /LENGTH=56 /DNA_ID=CAMNT_0017630991 /DNA_START=1 /DNA_END=168 /DNA_ORIENTATION=-
MAGNSVTWAAPALRTQAHLSRRGEFPRSLATGLLYRMQLFQGGVAQRQPTAPRAAS